MTQAVLTQPPDSPEVGRSGDAFGRTPGENAARYVELFDRIMRGSSHANSIDSPPESALRSWEGQPEWLGRFRREGIERFGRLGFPTTRNEDWHFTNVAPIAEREFTPLPGDASRSRGAAVTTEKLAPWLFPGSWQTLVFVNGHHVPELSDAPIAGDRLHVGSLASAIRDGVHADLVAQRLGSLAADQSNAFTALNSAFMQDGLLLVARGDTVAERPVHLLFVTDADAHADAGQVLVSPRNLILLDHHAEATVVESYVSIGSSVHLTNAVTEISLGDGARLRHYKIQRESHRGYHVASSYSHQSRGSNYETFSFATGADLSRTNVATVLDGEGAHATLNGLYMVNGEQTVDHQTRIEHAQENCTSHELYKGVLDGESHAVFNGQVFVRPEAQKTDGKQSNNNLLLSDRARVDTKPQLEIFADDVKCTHGATIGRLDPTALFYLKSRGIGEETSRKLLTYAFAAEVLEELTVESVREKLESLAFTRFAAVDQTAG